MSLSGGAFIASWIVSGVYGVLGDVSSARSWYEKAKEFGSKEALQRLEILAGREM